MNVPAAPAAPHTAEMYYPQEDGKLAEIPDEHARILALYRDRMPVVFEVQECGPPMLYPLIDEDAGMPGHLEERARRTANVLRAERTGTPTTDVADYEKLAVLAVRANLRTHYDFAASWAIHNGTTDETKIRRQADKALQRAADDLTTELTAQVRRAVAGIKAERRPATA